MVWVETSVVVDVAKIWLRVRPEIVEVMVAVSVSREIVVSKAVVKALTA